MNDATAREFADGLQERQQLSDDRPPVNDALPPHEYVESEFAPDCRRCDRCGGGPGAAIHQPQVDQMARIANALEEIAGALHRIEDHFRVVTEADTTAVYQKFMKERGL